MTVAPSEVLNLLKTGHLLSAKEIERRLGLDADPAQKPVRSAIDKLRLAGAPIWHDAGGFWWDDKYAVLPVGTPSRWKRAYVG